MAKFYKKTNYQEEYPGLSKEIVDFLLQSDRKIRYQQYDLKVGKCQFDYVKGTVTYLPSREDSYERLIEENKQFADEAESVEDVVAKAVMIEKMLYCIKLLDLEDQELIAELFFKGKSERELSAETGIPNMTLHDRKVKILGKLKKLMEK
ncbi:sigma-70 family RNA polymerase sigma factor [Sinanaerobacter chloroacetimidivorans]|uniref:Sigma-70 family RNA polymerase sigma factor n=1 Tax=Sinanaerobacter chloroacetimidivorans TaxID=2818044 RepID=A0A8J7W389_9FIRM|nr:sigma-70 family RNA polymerase sigma factor [Sinanaerobacter chloroacetimidivorans]MBR0598573.1 sigma-70 family RNA polymerase sigma factor [Sinanaerobacter chloroacetimidivorans]